MSNITVQQNLIFDEVTFLDQKASGGRVKAYGKKMAALVTVLNTIGWALTFGCYFQAKLIKIPGARNNYLYNTTLSKYLNVPPQVITAEMIQNLITVVKTSTQINELIKGLNVEDRQRAAAEMGNLEETATSLGIMKQLSTYVQRRMQFSDCYCLLAAIEFKGRLRCIGYFKDEDSAQQAIAFFQKLHPDKNDKSTTTDDGYEYPTFQLKSKEEEVATLNTSQLIAEQLKPIDDPLNPFR